MIEAFVANDQHPIFSAHLSHKIRLSSSRKSIQCNQNPRLSIGVQRRKNLDIVGARRKNGHQGQQVSDSDFHKCVILE